MREGGRRWIIRIRLLCVLMRGEKMDARGLLGNHCVCVWERLFTCISAFGPECVRENTLIYCLSVYCDTVCWSVCVSLCELSSSHAPQITREVSKIRLSQIIDQRTLFSLVFTFVLSSTSLALMQIFSLFFNPPVIPPSCPLITSSVFSPLSSLISSSLY